MFAKQKLVGISGGEFVFYFKECTEKLNCVLSNMK